MIGTGTCWRSFSPRPLYDCRHQQPRIGAISLQVAAGEPRRLADASAGLRQDLDQDAEGAILLICGLHDAQHVSIGQHHAAGVLAAGQAL